MQHEPDSAISLFLRPALLAVFAVASAWSQSADCIDTGVLKRDGHILPLFVESGPDPKPDDIVIDLSHDHHNDAGKHDGEDLNISVILTWVNGFWWAGAPQHTPGYGVACNGMVVIDRSGNATVQQALAAFINDFNALSNAIGRTCRFPVLTYYRDDAHIGQCQRSVWNFAGYSFATICSQPRPNPNGSGVSVAWTAQAGISHYQPNVHIQRDYPDYNSTYTHVGHELGHAMGLDHNLTEPHSIMYPHLVVGVRRGFTLTDLIAMANWYDHHVGP